MTPDMSCSHVSSGTDSTCSADADSWSLIPSIAPGLERASESAAPAGPHYRSGALGPPSTAQSSAASRVPMVVPRPLTEAQRRWDALRQHGDFTLAYNTLVQEGLEHFVTDAGYIAYRCFKGHVFVLGDPVAPHDGLAGLLGDFIHRFPKPTFAQISATTAIELQRLGYYINEMGVDTVLDLPEYSFAGKSMERIRYASNWLQKHGYSIEEVDHSATSRLEAMAVSDRWRSGMNCRKAEMRFLNRPICYDNELDVRKFFLRDDAGKLLAFVYFDPLYRDGKILGYATAIKRRLPEAPIYTEQGIMRAAVEKFKAEGLQRVHLGLSPMAGIENKRFRCNPFLHFSFRYAFGSWWVNRFFYNLQGHAQYKRHFKGREVAYHYASPVLFNDLRIYNLLRLTGVC